MPIISDAWDGLDELFRPGDEILLAEGAEDVVRILHNLREPWRRAIAAAAQARVLAGAPPPSGRKRARGLSPRGRVAPRRLATAGRRLTCSTRCPAP